MSCFGLASKLFLGFNILLFLLSIAVISIGGVVITQSSDYSLLLHYGFLSVPIWILVIGIFLLILSLYGLCAGYTENTCLLYTYATFISIFFFVGVTLLIYVTVEHKEAEERFKEELYEAFEEYGGGHDDDDDHSNHNQTAALDEAIDNLQQNLECCGVDQFSDWYNLDYGTVPVSCCVNSTVCDVESLNPTGIFKEGCFDRASEQLTGSSIAMFVVAIFLVIIQGLCLVLACGISAAINRYHYV